MNKPQNKVMTKNVEYDSEITLENILDHSPREPKKTKITGVITTILQYDAMTNHYCIQNPLDNVEQISVSKSTVEIGESTIGKEVLISFEDENVYRPVITGIIQKLESSTKSISNTNKQYQTKLDDSERLIFSAEREIVLQCGKSSIHLTKAGKVIIRGNYVLSRSTGLNSMKGGSVSIN